jgi:hypothetical protein
MKNKTIRFAIIGVVLTTLVGSLVNVRGLVRNTGMI